MYSIKCYDNIFLDNIKGAEKKREIETSLYMTRGMSKDNLSRLVGATLLAVSDILGYIPMLSDTVASAIYIYLEACCDENCCSNRVLNDFTLLNNRVHSPTVTRICAMLLNTDAYNDLKRDSIRKLSEKIENKLRKYLGSRRIEEEDILRVALRIYEKR